jgi:hypothetical protein
VLDPLPDRSGLLLVDPAPLVLPLVEPAPPLEVDPMELEPLAPLFTSLDVPRPLDDGLSGLFGLFGFALAFELDEPAVPFEVPLMSLFGELPLERPMANAGPAATAETAVTRTARRVKRFMISSHWIGSDCGLPHTKPYAASRRSVRTGCDDRPDGP